jgi:hypothetical protein
MKSATSLMLSTLLIAIAGAKKLRETLAVLAVVLAWAAVAQLADAELRAREHSAAARQA